MGESALKNTYINLAKKFLWIDKQTNLRSPSREKKKHFKKKIAVPNCDLIESDEKCERVAIVAPQRTHSFC